MLSLRLSVMHPCPVLKWQDCDADQEYIVRIVKFQLMKIHVPPETATHKLFALTICDFFSQGSGYWAAEGEVHEKFIPALL